MANSSETLMYIELSLRVRDLENVLNHASKISDEFSGDYAELISSMNKGLAVVKNKLDGIEDIVNFGRP